MILAQQKILSVSREYWRTVNRTMPQDIALQTQDWPRNALVGRKSRPCSRCRRNQSGTPTPQCEILIDANNGYTASDFLNYFERVLDVKVSWIEEPFQQQHDDVRTLREYLGKKGSNARIADGEGDEHDDAYILELAQSKLLDVV